MKNSPTILVVAGIMLVSLIFTAFHIGGRYVGLCLCLLLIYEGWTLINKYPNDTISEIVWMFSKRPWFPWLFGYATCAAIYNGYFINPHLLVFLGGLQGHFFFQREIE